MLVLATLASRPGYDLQTFRNFAGSLVETGFDGKIAVITTQSNFENQGLDKLEDDYPCLEFIFVPEITDYENINCYRYGYYREYLASLDETFESIMLTDARDVIFQRDISQYPFDQNYDLFFAEEEKVIKDCSINSGWIRNLYGQEVLEALRKDVVLCSGTTIGKFEAVCTYIDCMEACIHAVQDRIFDQFGHLGGIDQGVHNYIYYRQLLPELKIKSTSNSENMVYTVGHVAGDEPGRPFLNDEFRFINQSGQECYCVHQYDRLPRSLLDVFNANSEFSI